MTMLDELERLSKEATPGPLHIEYKPSEATK